MSKSFHFCAFKICVCCIVKYKLNFVALFPPLIIILQNASFSYLRYFGTMQFLGSFIKTVSFFGGLECISNIGQ